MNIFDSLTLILTKWTRKHERDASMVE